MSIIRPVRAHMSPTHPEAYFSGRVTQDFDGAFYMERPGYIRASGVAVKRGKRAPFTGAAYRKDLHLAIDYGCPNGTPVYAVQSGTILSQGTDSTGGVFIYLRVKKNLTHQIIAFYYHLKPGSLRFRVGQHVNQGQVIAEVGNTGGVSTGSHLHFTLMRGPRARSMSWFYSNAMRFDPQPFINGRAMATIL